MPIPVYATPVGRNRKFSTNGRLRIEATHSLPLAPGASYPGLKDAWVTIEYSDDDNQWQTLRGSANRLYPDASGKVVVYDYEAPPGQARLYRSFVNVLLANGDLIPGEISNIGIGVMYLKSVWIKDVFNPILNFSIPVADKWLPVTRNKNSELKAPLGRDKPIIVRQKGKYESFTMNFTCLGDANWDRLQTLLEGDRTLLLQTPRTQWYVQSVGSPSWNEDMFSVYEESARQVSVDLVEVDPV